jgi:methyl-accepting chemotaxis protein
MNAYTLLSRIALWKKLAILASGLLVPALGFGYLYVTDAQASLATAERESVGADYLEALSGVLAPLSRHRGLAGAYLNGDVSFKERVLVTQTDVDQAIATMNTVDARFAASLGVSGKWAQLRDAWRVLRDSALTAKSAAESYEQHSALIGQLGALSNEVRDRSELSFDPVVATYHIQNIAFDLVPNALDSLATLRGKATSAASKGTITPELRADVLALRDVIPWHLARIESDLERLRAANATLADAAKSAKQQLDAASRTFTDLVYQRMLKSDTAGGITAAEAFDAGDKAAAALLSLSAALKTDLVEQLDDRQTALARKRNAALASVLAALGLACALAWVITRSITRPLAHAVATFASIATGKYDNAIELAGTDEAGQLLQSLDGMQGKLRTQIETERAQAAVNSRLKSALDASSANVVVADEQFSIIYCNEAAGRLFRDAQDDFRRQVSSFDANRLIGSSIDVFHEAPEQQRALLGSLSSTHTADIRIGTRRMRQVATPVITTDAGRIGTVIEWMDRTQECNAQDEVEEIVRKALAGDLRARARLDDKSGFFAVLGRGLNELLENMAAMVLKIKAAALEVHRGADEISQGNANLSQRTEEQSSSLEETASSMEQMTSTVKQNADNAGQANQLAIAARDQAERGGTVTGQAVRAMGVINDASSKIADIIGVIDEIAFQTNLLALNAAVEAARAGEQGRGFAVVASEVRALAGRSATAAKEIKTLIEDSVQKVGEGARLVNESGSTLVQIVTSVKKVSDIVAEIAAASREQSSGIEQVNKAVMQMDEMTQQNAALVEQASAASQSMADQARSLNETMARYQLGDSDTHVQASPATLLRAAPATATKLQKARKAVAR